MSEKNSNSFGSMVKLGLTLAAYAVISCFCLAIVNNLTAPVIKQHEQQALQAGLKDVFADADKFDAVSAEGYTAAANATIKNVYKALDKNGNMTGIVVEIYGKTYDYADILIGFKNDESMTITGMKFLTLSDSPGFGQKAQDPGYTVKSGKTFYGQFAGKKASDGFKINETYDAITGATITSKSVGVLLQQAAATAGEVMGNKSVGTPAAARTTPFTEEETFLQLFPSKNYKNITQYLNPTADIAKNVPAAGTIIRNMKVGNTYVFKETDENGKQNIVGAAIVLTGNGAHGDAMTIITGVDQHRTIAGARIIALNDNMTYAAGTLDTPFYSQFTGKSADQDFVPAKDFDAVSGATVSSACVADIVKVGAVEAAKIMAANGGDKAPAGSDNYKLNEMKLED